MSFKSLLIALVISPLLPAQTLVLQDCIALAMKNNDQIKLIELDAYLNDLKVEETSKLLYPRLTFNAGYTYNYQLPKQFLPASTFGGPAGTYKEITFGVPHTTTTNVQASQVIYNKTISYGIEKIKAAKSLTAIQIQKTKENLAYQIGILYYNAQSIQLQKQFLEQSITNAEKLLFTTKEIFKSGRIKATDVEQVELNKKMLTNQKQQLDIAYKQILNNLSYLLNTNDTISIAGVVYPNLPTNESNTGSGTNTDIALLDQQEKLLNLDLQGYLYEAYPTITGFANYNYNGTGKTGADAFFKFIPSGAVGVQLSVNLYDWGLYKTKKAQKAHEISKLTLQKTIIEDGQQKDKNNAILKIKSINQSLALEKENIQLAQKLIEKAQEQYQAGIIAIPEVVSRENVLIQVQNNYVRQFIDLRITEWELKRISNELVKN